MALSSAEIESLRRYLGYPAGAQYKTELTNRCTEVLDTFSAWLRYIWRPMATLMRLPPLFAWGSTAAFTPKAAALVQFEGDELYGPLCAPSGSFSRIRVS